MLPEDCEKLIEEVDMLKRIASSYRPNTNIDTIIKSMESRIKEFKKNNKQ